MSYQVGTEQDQGNARKPFGAFAPAFTDPGADRKAELSGHEGLQGDGRDHGYDRQPGQADAEPDGQLVLADTDPEPASLAGQLP